LDSETDLQTDSQADLQTDVECETITHPDVSQTDIEPGTSTQTDTDLSDLPPAKRLRTDSGNVLYEVSDHRSSQQEIVSEDNFAILHDLLTDGTADQTDEVTLQPTTSVKNDQIRKMVDANYAKTVQNTMRKYNKKVSRGNDSIVKGSFVTVRIPTVDRASGDLRRLLCKVVDVVVKDGSLFKLACPYGILNSLYDMGDLELLNSVVDISHWVETPISLHAAAKQDSHLSPRSS
jgi:hypothetical protein